MRESVDPKFRLPKSSLDREGSFEAPESTRERLEREREELLNRLADNEKEQASLEQEIESYAEGQDSQESKLGIDLAVVAYLRDVGEERLRAELMDMNEYQREGFRKHILTGRLPEIVATLEHARLDLSEPIMDQMRESIELGEIVGKYRRKVGQEGDPRDEDPEVQAWLNFFKRQGKPRREQEYGSPDDTPEVKKKLSQVEPPAFREFLGNLDPEGRRRLIDDEGLLEISIEDLKDFWEDDFKDVLAERLGNMMDKEDI